MFNCNDSECETLDQNHDKNKDNSSIESGSGTGLVIRQRFQSSRSEDHSVMPSMVQGDCLDWHQRGLSAEVQKLGDSQTCDKTSSISSAAAASCNVM